MKYLAILKDSLREAIDTKVFYVMVGLSGLLMLFIASISFRPLSMEEELKVGFRQFNWLLSLQAQNQAQKDSLRFEISDFEQLRDGGEPWLGDYRFTFHMHVPNEAGQAAKGQIRGLIRALRGMMGGGQVKQLIQARFPWLNEMTVKEVKSPNANEERYVVTTQGTKITDRRNWPHEPSLFFGAVPLGFWDSSLGGTVHFVEDALVNGFGAWTAVLVGIVVTAFFIPNMLRKGTLDLLLAKPIHRTTLLVFKYLGGLTFMFLNAVVVVLGIWLVLGLRSGIWATGFLYSIGILTFFFAILYAVSTLFGVWTRSPIVAILMTCVVWFVLWLVSFLQTALDNLRRQEAREKEVAQQQELPPQGDPGPEEPEEQPSPRLQVPQWVYSTVAAVHYVLPRTKDLDRLTTQLLSRQLLTADERRQEDLDRFTGISWGESLSVSGIFIAVMLSLACWRFATKDY
jgi:ABC-type transport system involved in multi-copper enzyme maturation permease subunit